jgi:hypothetical protein
MPTPAHRPHPGTPRTGGRAAGTPRPAGPRPVARGAAHPPLPAQASAPAPHRFSLARVREIPAAHAAADVGGDTW